MTGMKVWIVYDHECTYAVKLTRGEARAAAHDVWLDVAFPEEWECWIGELDTSARAPQSWPETEHITFDSYDEPEEDDDG